LLLTPLSRRTAGETVNAAFVKKALAKSMLDFKPKAQIVFLGLVYVLGRYFQEILVVKGVKTIPHPTPPPHLLDISSADLFSFKE
jgi:hypothetical protein